MIRSFGNSLTERIWRDQRSARLDQAVVRAALNKLQMLNAAKELKDLLEPGGNRLKRLTGNRRHQFSIRVNAKWRICFTWTDGGAEDVVLVDYH